MQHLKLLLIKPKLLIRLLIHSFLLSNLSVNLSNLRLQPSISIYDGIIVFNLCLTVSQYFIHVELPVTYSAAVAFFFRLAFWEKSSCVSAFLTKTKCTEATYLCVFGYIFVLFVTTIAKTFEHGLRHIRSWFFQVEDGIVICELKFFRILLARKVYCEE